MPHRIFITGATGRIGVRLVAALAAQGHEVVGLARSEERASAVREAGGTALVGDLADSSVIQEGARNSKVIYHLAGALRGPGTATPDQINHQGTRSLLSSLGAETCAGLDALVFTSSSAVYGDRSSLWVDETIPPHPTTRYGKSKADAENLLLAAAENDGLPARIVRLSTVYGPGFPFLMADQIKEGKGWLPGEGRNYVSVIHVDDAVEGLVRIAERGENGQVYNLSSPIPTTMAEFYTAVHAHVGGQPMRFWSTWIPSYVQFWAARNNERLQSRLGRRPLFTPDNLRLFTSSARLKVERMEKELEFEWRYPEIEAGVAAVFNGR